MSKCYLEIMYFIINDLDLNTVEGQTTTKRRRSNTAVQTHANPLSRINLLVRELVANRKKTTLTMTPTSSN